MKQFIASISKWYMADVFAMGILIAFHEQQPLS